MKAMILAAGVGKRLRPLTDTLPKALIEMGGIPMLELVIRRLMRAGAREIVVNVFHLADRIEDFLRAKDRFGIRIELSRETELLDTGGGLKKAAPFFDDGRPFFLHNVDVVTDLDLSALYRHHLEHPALATLAVRARRSSRSFLFAPGGRLCGWESSSDGKTEWAGPPVAEAQRLAFDGVQVLSPDIFSKMLGTGAFPLTQTYLHLARRGERIQAHRSDTRYWADIGTEAKLAAARRHIEKHGLPS